jgi:hypothetical protein
MNLDTFITTTLKSIVQGIKDSQDFAYENGARINPKRKHSTPLSHLPHYTRYPHEDDLRSITKIEFDVAVTTSNTHESGVDGGIKVIGLNLGGKNIDSGTNEVVSRIKFSVDIVLPSGND